MGNKYLKRINKFLSFFILISIVSFYVGFYPSSVYAQGTEVRRALPVGANVGDIAPRAIPVDDPTLIEASSVGLNLEIIGGSAISGCMAELLGGVLANSLSAGINTLLSAINLRVVVSNPALETKETGPSIGPIQLPSLDAIGFCLVNATIEAILAGTIFHRHRRL